MAGRKKTSLFHRFDEKWTRFDDSDCWGWIGSRNKRGYGQISVAGTPRLAHRISWLISNGQIPDGLHVLHRCDNPSCVNPEHLFLGTDKDNVQDMLKKGRENRNSRLSGEKHGMAVLTDEKAVQIYTDTAPQRDIAKRFGVSQGTVSHIKTGRQWSSVTGAIKKEKVPFQPS